MKKQEIVFRIIACRYLKGINKFTQLELAKTTGMSLSTVNLAVGSLSRINALRVSPRQFSVISLERLLLFWATHRSIMKDIVYSTRVDMPVKEIERSMPDNIAFTAYTAYKLIYNDVPADYSEVYIYAESGSLSGLSKRFGHKEENPNLFVLKADVQLAEEIREHELKHSSVCAAQVFIDLWNINSWYASDFVAALRKRLDF